MKTEDIISAICSACGARVGQSPLSFSFKSSGRYQKLLSGSIASFYGVLASEGNDRKNALEALDRASEDLAAFRSGGIVKIIPRSPGTLIRAGEGGAFRYEQELEIIYMEEGDV